MISARRLAVVAASAVLALPFVSAQEAKKDTTETGPVSYYREIRPILQQHCQGCHQPAKAEGGYLMTSYAELFKKSDRDEPGVIAGQPDKSSLYKQIIPQNGKPPAMPRGKDPLIGRDVELVRKWIAEGAKDDTPASAKEIAYDMEHPPKYSAPPVITAVEYSPDGQLLAVSGYHEVLLLGVPQIAPDAKDAVVPQPNLVARLVGMSERIQSLAFSPDGKMLAVTGGSPGRFGEVQIWNVDRVRLRLSLPVTFDTLYGASWSPDGKLLAFGGADNSVRAIDAETGKQVLFGGGHSDWVLDTVFSKDGTHLVSVSRDRSMKLTEVSSQRLIDNITSITPGALKGGLMCVDRNPGKDELLIGGADGVPKVYQMFRTKDRKIGDDFNLIRKYTELPGRLFAVEYSRDGNRIAAGSSSNGKGEVRIFQEADGKAISKLEGERGPIYSLAFHPNGKQIASAGFDGMVRINDTDTGKLISEFVPCPLEK